MNLQHATPQILPVACHTNNVGKGTTFVAIQGTRYDGLDFIEEALKKGANKIVVQEGINLPIDTLNKINQFNAELIKVSDCRLALSQLSASAWNNPAKKLKIIGITGTKGKTTSAFLLNHLLSCSGHKTAMISGVQNIINDKKYLASLTTPHPDYLHAFFNECVQQDIEYVVMESSAQAFSLKRLNDVEFSGAIFTNLDQEHMEFYSSMNEYFMAKCEILKQMKSKAPVIVNSDNIWGNKVAMSSNEYLSVSFKKNTKSNVSVQIKSNNSSGLELAITSKKGKFTFQSGLFGNFNAYNISCVIALCFELGVYPKSIMEGLRSFSSVPGRMEKYKLPNGAQAIIDYAHNPSSFEHVLPTIKGIAKKLIVVFGAGGDRDKSKRSVMGKIASKIADQIIITSDNPRSEDANDIMQQIVSGITKENLRKVICEVDRAEAIKKAYEISEHDDVIAILGKGPDEYQIIGNQKFYFSDKENILSCN